jgi:uncharacterized protein (UPF0276 family)
MKTAPARHPVPASAGVGLRAPHLEQVLAERPRVPWFEVHSENLFAGGGTLPDRIEKLRADYPLSLHGVGLSLGSADGLDRRHLDRLAEVVNRFQPALVSEHLSWAALGGRHSNDLLPLPFTEQALTTTVAHIGQAQDRLGRELLVENVSSYLRFADADYSEWDFVAEVVRLSGCGLLLDVNNVYVNSINHGFDADDYLRALPAGSVREIHLAGFTRKTDLPVPLLIDTHSKPVDGEVWSLYARALDRFGPVPTLIEWDADIPPLAVLLAEAARAEELLDEHRLLAA